MGHNIHNNKNKVIHKHQISVLEKYIYINFIVGMKFHYGPKVTPSTLPYILGNIIGSEPALVSNRTIVNLFILVNQLRKIFSLLYITAYNKGLGVLSGKELQEKSGIGARHFYFFSPWHPGFLTNFFLEIDMLLLENIY